MAMRLGLRTNASAVLDDMEAFVAAHLQAVPRALNRLRDQAATAGFRQVADMYQVPVRAMRDRYSRLEDANRIRGESSINVKGKGFALYGLSARQTKAGVSVVIKGRRRLIRGAFLKRLPKTGHIGVFARGVYGATFQFRRGRLPINELFSFAPPDAFSNPEVVETMNDRVESQAFSVLQAEIRFATR